MNLQDLPLKVKAFSALLFIISTLFISFLCWGCTVDLTLLNLLEALLIMGESGYVGRCGFFCLPINYRKLLLTILGNEITTQAKGAQLAL